MNRVEVLFNDRVWYFSSDKTPYYFKCLNEENPYYPIPLIRSGEIRLTKYLGQVAIM